MKDNFDITIIGAGILGVAIAFWLSRLSRSTIALIDRESDVAMNTSSRNTGVIHRPFYLHPGKKRIFANASQKSYFLWSKLVSRYDFLPWNQVGTLEVALDESQVPTLLQYESWAEKNGMEESEVEILDSAEVRKLEPLVSCAGAIHSKKDTAVQYGDFTRCLFELAQKNGVVFLKDAALESALEGPDGVDLSLRSKAGTFSKIHCNFMINAAGGGAIDIAHQMGLAKQFTDLHFRGEYWRVEDSFGREIKRNIYSVARHKEFPFLDPHFIVRANGQREVGPNAVLVSGPNVYRGLAGSTGQVLHKLFERPITPKVKLFSNPRFVSLVWHEWRSSIYKTQMCKRVMQFIPSLEVSKLRDRGLAGVRSSVIDASGFVPEAITVEGERSFHILNYNSPGATGAPAYAAYIVKKIFEQGFIAPEESPIQRDVDWDFESASDL